MLAPAAPAPAAAPPRRVLLSVVTVSALAMAGCIGQDGGDLGAAGGPPPVPAILEGWVERALPFGEGHEHSDVHQHLNLTTANFEQLGWDPLITGYKEASAGGYFCGDRASRADGMEVAVVHSFTTDVAFVVIDVTDPNEPVMLGEYILEFAHTYDVAVTKDGMHVLVGTSFSDTGPDGGVPGAPGARGVNVPGLAEPLVQGIPGARDHLPAEAPVVTVQPKWRDACTGEVRNAGPEQALPLASGVVLVGIQDPRNPVFEQYFPTPLLGPHSMSTGVGAQGQNLAVASITNLVHGISYFAFFEVVDTPAGGALAPQSVWPAALGGNPAFFNGHIDATIHTHPVTGQTLAYLANWDGGVVVLDISIPQAPVLLGQWTGGGAIHETYPMDELWDERHYTLAGQELGGHPEGRPTGWVFILDTTDPANPVEVGRWTLPQDIEWSGFLQFSTHYVTVVERTMFVSLYHGGLWAVDISTPERLAEPRTVGVFVPSEVSPKPPAEGQAFSWTPTVLDTLATPEGNLIVYDGPSGAYVVRFHREMEVPLPTEWRS